MPSTNQMVTARLTGGRLLIAILDPDIPDRHSPLRHHLRNETPHAEKGLKGPAPGTPFAQVSSTREELGE